MQTFLIFHSDSSDTWMRIADFGSWMVVVGVFAEVVEIAVKMTQQFRKSALVAARMPKVCAMALLWHQKHELLFEIWGLVWWGVVVLGLVVELGANQRARRIDGGENAQLRERAANLETANLLLRANVASLEIKASAFEIEAAQLATNVANLNPGKWPVHSVTADVRLQFLDRDLVGDLSFPARLAISDSTGRQVVRLSARGAVDVADRSTGSRNVIYSLQFSSPFRTIPMNPVGPLPILPGLTGDAASEALDKMSLVVTNFPRANATIFRANAVVTINEVIQRRFIIETGEIRDGTAVLTGYLNTNIPPRYLDRR